MYIMDRDDTARVVYKLDYATGDIVFPVSDEDVESLPKPAEPATESPNSTDPLIETETNYSQE